MRAGKPTQPWKSLKFYFACALVCPLGSCSASCLHLWGPVPCSHLALTWSSSLASLILRFPLSPLVFSSLIQHCCFIWTRATEKNRLCGWIPFPHSHLHDFQTWVCIPGVIATLHCFKYSPPTPPLQDPPWKPILPHFQLLACWLAKWSCIFFQSNSGRERPVISIQGLLPKGPTWGLWM